MTLYCPTSVKMAKILLVEDDIGISRSVKDWLLAEQHKVDTAFTGTSALDYLNSFEYDLLILDRQLPELNGIEICKYYRNKCDGFVLMLTGMSSIEDKIDGLEAGADDYLTKPFDMRELLARVKALLRRPEAVEKAVLAFKNISLDTQSRIVRKDGKELSLTPREYDVLQFFFKHPNQVITQETLLKRIWHSDSSSTHHAVYNCLNRLRKNLDPTNKEALIKTVHGIGYRLDAE